MFCKKCGRQLEDNATYCPNCNSPTVNANNTQSDVPNNTYNSNNYNNTPTTSTVDGYSIAGIILGGVGCVLAWIIALFGYIFGGAGIVLAIVGKKKNDGSKLFLVAIIVSVVAIVFALTNSILGVLMFLGMMI